jgi:List-Bact-rpt repeat protein
MRQGAWTKRRSVDNRTRGSVLASAVLIGTAVVLLAPLSSEAAPKRPLPLSLASSPTAIGASFGCNGGPCAARYPAGTALTIVASAPGYTLTGYSGACNGTSCSFTMPSGGASVTASFAASTRQPTVWVAPALKKIRPSEPAGTPGAAAQISAARNEFEAFQIVITGSASGVIAVASDLVQQGASGAPYVIPGSRPAAGLRPGVHLFREATIDVTQVSSADPESKTGPWPDALVPDRDELLDQQRNAFTSFDVNGDSRAIWYEVFVPAGAPPGVYSGTVTVTYGGANTVTVPVQLTVWAFTLPSTASLRSAFGLGYGALPAGHGFNPADLATFTRIRNRYGQYALDHRVSLSHVDDGWAYADLNYFKASYGNLLDGTAPTRLAGARMTAVEYLGGLADQAKLQAWSTFFDQNASTSGWPRNILFQYACDEPPGTCAWTDIVTRATAAHRANPPIRSLVTTSVQLATANPSSGLSASAVLDVIVPVVNHMDDKGTSSYAGNQRPAYDGWLANTSLYPPTPGATPIETGIPRELWSYQSCMSHDCGGVSSYGTGWPSYMIDANAIRNRAMQWLLFGYGETGELYYETAYAYSGAAWSSQWAFTGNGDGTLFYPGTTARIGGPAGSDVPVPSLRLKLIREGMEDFEYLQMLSRYPTCTDPATGATGSCSAYALGVAKTVYPDMYTTNGSPETLMSKRAEMAGVLEQLVRTYGQR